MADNVKNITIKVGSDPVGFQQITQQLNTLATTMKRTFKEISDVTGGFFGVSDKRPKSGGSNTGSSKGSTTSSTQQMNIGGNMGKTLQDLTGAMRTFATAAGSSLGSATNTIKSNTQSQIMALDQLKRKYEEVGRAGSGMGGGRPDRSFGGDFNDWKRANPAPAGGEAWGGRYEAYRQERAYGQVVNERNADYGRTAGSVQGQFDTAPMQATQGTKKSDTHYTGLIAAAVGATIMGANEYYNLPFNEVEHRASRGEFYGQKVQDFRTLSPKAAMELRAMQRLYKKDMGNVVQLADPKWLAAATTVKGAGSAVQGFMGGVTGGGATSGTGTLTSSIKYLEDNLNMEAYQRFVGSEMKADPVDNARMQRFFSNNAAEIGGMRGTGVGQKYDPVTQTWKDNFGMLQASLRARGFDTGQYAGGFASVEGTGGYGTGSKYADLAMRGAAGHMSNTGSMIGAAAQMGVDPRHIGSVFKQMVGTFKDDGASNMFGGYLAKKALSGGSLMDMAAMAGSLTANMPEGKSAGSQMFMAQGIMNANENQEKNLYGGGRDGLQKGLNLSYAYQSGATGMGAALLANNDKLGQYAAYVTAHGTLPQELQGWGLTPEMVLETAQKTQGSQFRNTAQLAGALSPNSDLGKAYLASQEKGMDFNDYVKTLGSKEQLNIKTKLAQGSGAIDQKHTTFQDALGNAIIDPLQSRRIKGRGPKDTAAGSRAVAIEKKRAAADKADVEAGQTAITTPFIDSFGKAAANAEDQQHSTAITMEGFIKNLVEVAEATEEFRYQLNQTSTVLKKKNSKMDTQ